jgi:hypothetical protein
LTAPQSLAALRQDLFLFSAKWWSYLLPPVQHILLGSWSADVWQRAGVREGLLEQQLFLGWSLLALAAIPLIDLLRRRGDPRRALFLAGLAAAAGFCSLSPERQIESFTFVRPSALLYPIAPMFRAYARFGVVAHLMVATLAGAGLARLLTSDRRGLRLSAVALAAGIVIDFTPAPLQPWREPWPSPGYRSIARSGRADPVFVCARASVAVEQSIRWLLQRPVGFLGQQIDDCGAPDLSGTLAGLGYTQLWVPLEHDEPSSQPPLAQDTGLAQREVLDDGRLFAVLANRPALVTTVAGGFYDREYLDGETWRWMQQIGRWRVMNTTAATLTATATLELSPFAAPRSLALAIDGRPLTQLDLTMGSRVYAVGPIAIAPGPHELTFTALEPGLRPDQLTDAKDRRLLTVAWKRWTWMAE